MYRIYRPNEYHNPLLFDPQHSMLFDLEPSKFSYTDDIKNCDFVAMLRIDGPQLEAAQAYLKELNYSGPVLVLHLYHIDERHPQPHADPVLDQLRKQCSSVNIVHTNLAARDQGIYLDFLWEKQRVYFTEYSQHPQLPNYNWVYHTTEKMWELDTITVNAKPKLFLAPMRIYTDHPRGRLRSQLRKQLQHSRGYVSDHSRGVVIEPQEYSGPIRHRYHTEQNNYSAGTTYPAHNRYYRDSIASIYVETLVYGREVRSITEKTWDPLIKGHYIIPYGYQGLIQDLKQYGVQLPDWIDYSYDSEPDQTRFEKYQQSVQQFLDTDIKTLKRNYCRTHSMLLHNRQLFFNSTGLNTHAAIENWLNS
jgi:hypothetical protein